MAKSFILCISLAIAAFAQETDEIYISAGRVITVLGEELKDALIKIKGGEIVEITTGKAPAGANTINASKNVVMPGIVDAAFPFEVNEEESEVTPNIKMSKSISPRDPVFKKLLIQGVTTINFRPGERNVVGGRCAVFKCDGKMLTDSGLLFATVSGNPADANESPRRRLGGGGKVRRPTTRMGVVWELRNALYKKIIDANDRILVSAYSVSELESVARLVDEFGLKNVIIEGGDDAHKCVGVLKGKIAGIVLKPDFRTTGIFGEEYQPRFDNLALLLKEGFVVAVSPSTSSDKISPLLLVAIAVKYGCSRSDALKCVTANPAKLLGIDAGTVEPKKAADFVIFSEDPLSPVARIEHVIVGGKTVWSAASSKTEDEDE